MAEAYDVALRERAVAAYHAGRGGYHELAGLFQVGWRTLQRWVYRQRATGSVAPTPKGGGWLTLRTKWRAMNTESFIQWMRRGLARHLRPGDIVVLDNLNAHKSPVVRALIERRGAQVKLLPPDSHDFNPIEAAWALIKKHIRTYAPRPREALRRVARAGRYVVRPHHCRQYFAHAGYVNSSA